MNTSPTDIEGLGGIRQEGWGGLKIHETWGGTRIRDGGTLF